MNKNDIRAGADDAVEVVDSFARLSLASARLVASLSVLAGTSLGVYFVYVKAVTKWATAPAWLRWLL